VREHGTGCSFAVHPRVESDNDNAVWISSHATLTRETTFAILGARVFSPTNVDL
jgi:hypothetical protein